MPMELTISVSKGTADFVRRRVAETGTTIDDVVAEALALMRDRQRRLAELRAELRDVQRNPDRYSPEDVEDKADLLFALKCEFEQIGTRDPVLYISDDELASIQEMVRKFRSAGSGSATP